MTRKDFIEAHKHRLAGFVLDAAVEGRRGGELALWLRLTMQQIDAYCGAMYDAAQPDPPAPAGKPPAASANGTHPAPAAGTPPRRS